MVSNLSCNSYALAGDEWLSAQLGRPAYHLKGDCHGVEAATLPPEPVFIDAKVRADDTGAIHALERAGFRLGDTNLQFIAHPVTVTSDHAAVRFARPEDRQAVRDIARRTFTFDRFHQDSRVPPEIADELKAVWAENFFAGKRGEWMVIAEDAAGPAGFLQLLRDDDNRLVIDLIGVAKRARRRGLGAAMIAFASRRCLPERPVLVGTQAANIASVRFYESLGFRLVAAQHVFHFHGRENQ